MAVIQPSRVEHALSLAAGAAGTTAHDHVAASAEHTAAVWCDCQGTPHHVTPRCLHLRGNVRGNVRVNVWGDPGVMFSVWSPG